MPNIILEPEHHVTLDPDGDASLDFEMDEYTPMVSSDLPIYTGATTVIPSTHEQTLETANTAMLEDITVEAIPYDEVETATPVISVDNNGKVTATTNQQGGIVEASTKSAEYQQQAVEQATPTISVDNAGKITASATQTAGFVVSGTKSAELQQQTVPQATPSIDVANDGTITAAATQTAGFVNAGTKSAAYSLPTQAAKTVTPTESAQTAVAAGKWTTGAVQVGAIPSDYIKPSGTLNITENGVFDVTSYASVNVHVAVRSFELKYYSWDGGTLLYTETVTEGGDGAYDSQPTRQSTAQYSYSFIGWSTSTDAYTADANATKNVTADRSIYAAYSRTVRTYTVTFNNSNGTTLQTVNNVPYGGSATYTGSTPVDPDGEGKEFLGWNPAPTNIQGDTTCVAQYQPLEPEHTITDTWDQILAAINDGTYKTKYSVGDTMSLDLGSEGYINVKIAAFDTDPRADGNGNAEITWVADQLLATSYRMNQAYEAGTDGTGTLGGWEHSEMRSYLHTTILPLVPANVAAAVRPVTKYSRIYNTSGTAVDNSITSDMIWVPGAHEVGVADSIENSGARYDGIFSSDETRRKKSVSTGYAGAWALRSASSSTAWYRVVTSGKGFTATAETSVNVIIGFCTCNTNPVEISDSWDTIIANANAGTVSGYNVGDYKPLDLGTEGVVNMQIVGKGVDPLASGNGYAALTFVAKELLATSHRMNPALDGATDGTGAIGGWEHSDMRSYLQTTIAPLVPANVAAAIKPVTKYSRTYDTSGAAVDNVATTDSLWIPSSHEVGTNTSQESSCPSYSEVFKDNASRIKKKVGASSASIWWLRSASSASDCRNVTSGGHGNNGDAYNSRGVALGFCI